MNTIEKAAGPSGAPGPDSQEFEEGGIRVQRAAMTFGPDQPLALDSGVNLSPFTIAYETYGTLNADKSNVVLICHALTGDQYAASSHPQTGKPGWWPHMVGPGRPIDTNRFFVVCQNVIGGCQGTTGPKDIDPATGRPYGLSFPVITIGDMVRAQAMLLIRNSSETSSFPWYPIATSPLPP